MISNVSGAWLWLQHDHTHLWVQIQDFRAFISIIVSDDDLSLLEDALQGLRDLQAELIVHFEREETELFPQMLASAPELRAVVETLEAEHGLIRELLVRIDGSLRGVLDEGQAGKARLVAEVEHLVSTLRVHSDTEWELAQDVVKRYELQHLLFEGVDGRTELRR